MGWAHTAQAARPGSQQRPGLAAACCLTGPLPHPRGRRERSRERLLKFLSGEINIEAISEQVFQLWAWRLSPVPVTGTDSCLLHLCYPPWRSGPAKMPRVASPQDSGTVGTGHRTCSCCARTPRPRQQAGPGGQAASTKAARAGSQRHHPAPDAAPAWGLEIPGPMPTALSH